MTPTENRHPFYRPLWRRVAICVGVGAWTVVEAIGGDPFWTVITGALLAYAVWTFLIRYPKDADGPAG